MGCGRSKPDDHRTPLGVGTVTMSQGNGGQGAMFVREFVDESVYDMYDFTGPVLGSGAFATVLTVKDKMSGVGYAIKQIDLSKMKDDSSTMRMLFNEIQGMKALSHPNIVRLQEVYTPKEEEMMYLVLDRLDGGSIDALRKQKGHLEEGFAAYIMAQVVDAVRYCHSLNIAHRDLKLANCMFEDHSETPIVKIIDFGLCAELKDGQTSSAFVGTMTHAAPEVVMKNMRHGVACDLWSVGVMVYTLVSGSLPFAAEDPGALIHQIKYGEPSYSAEVWKGVSALCRDFINKCLEKKPTKRITAKQAQSHPWIKKAVKAMDRAPLSKDAMISLVKFQERNLFEKVALELVAYSHEPSHIRKLELRFREMDKTGEGVLSLSEFKAAVMEGRLSSLQSDQQQKQHQEGGTTTKQTSSSLAAAEKQEETKTEPMPTEPDLAAKAIAASPESKSVIPGEGTQAVAPRTTVAPAAPSLEEPPSGVMPGGDEGGRVSAEPGADLGEGPNQSEQQQQQQQQQQQRGREEEEGKTDTLSSKKDVSQHGAPSDRGPPSVSGRGLLRTQSSRSHAIGGLDEEEVERMFAAIDVDNSGTIDITEFVAASLAKLEINSRVIKAAFSRLDCNRTGLIKAEDMRLYMGDRYDESNMEEYMRDCSSREDGLVSLEDFTRCLKANLLTMDSSSRSSSRRVTTESTRSADGAAKYDDSGRPKLR